MANSLTMISLGAGVQSSTMALMAARGELTPMPHGAVFADTQSEPDEVYKWLDWLEKQLPFPVYRVTKGNLAEVACHVRKSAKGNNYTKSAVPAFIKDTNGKIGLAMRQCTTDFKIDVIYREYNRLRGKQPVEQWVGISRDEATRMKPARRSWVTNRYPLIDAGITRTDCLRWMSTKGYPVPPRSACVFCPYHNNAEWLRLKTNDSKSFGAAVKFEKDYQNSLKQVSGFRGTPFLNRSCLSLETINFLPKQNPQLNLF